MITSLLVPVDGSDLAEQVVPRAMRLAATENAIVIVVLAHARTPRTSDSAPEYDLLAAAERVRAYGVQTETRTLDVADGDVRRALCDATHEQPTDLVAMAAHGLGWRGGRFFGGVADRVFRATEAPILLIPAAYRQPWTRDHPLRIVIRLDDPESANQLGMTVGTA
ncbi:MAG: universal stress protein [Chloroflexi bacterium]|nr:universal stress protein [Chloroflexota bacterium]